MEKKVLIIDDEPIILDSISRLLEEEGYITDTIEGCRKTLEQGVAGYDLIICDYQMPDITGLDILRKIRAEGILTPFIFLSGFCDESVINEATEAGIKDIFQKPLDIDFLLNRIEEILS